MLTLCPSPNRIDEGSLGDFKDQPGTAKLPGQLEKRKVRQKRTEGIRETYQ